MNKVLKIVKEFQKTRNQKTKKAHCAIFVTDKKESDYFKNELYNIYSNSLLDEQFLITRDRVIFKDSGDTIGFYIIKDDCDYNKFHGMEFCMIASLCTKYWDSEKMVNGRMGDFNNYIWSCLRDSEEDKIELKFLKFNMFSDNVKFTKHI